MSLLQLFLSLVSLWRPAFCKNQAFYRVKDHAVASICAIGRHTITNTVIWMGRDQKSPSSDYRVYSEYKWNVEDLFDPLLEKCLQFSPDDYVVVGADDTRIKKTGKKIPGTSWGPDRMGPPFQVNLIWCQRYLQFSCLLPLYKNSNVQPRGIPIRFVHAPPLKKPGKRASSDEVKAYQSAKKTQNLSTTFVQEVGAIRKSLDKIGAVAKKLLIVADGSFCNKICMSMDVERTEIIARARKDACLCDLAPESSRKTYGKEKFTPEQVRKNDLIPWQKACLFYGGEWRTMRYKELKPVYWQRGAKTRPLRLFVLAPLPYVKGGIRNYRSPAYLLCTDLEASATFLLQSYFDRWQIEVNFREEKSIIGVGKSQVWNPKSVERQPAFAVACYAALLLASVIHCRDCPWVDDCIDQPYWRPPPNRLTCRALVGIIRKSLLENPIDIVRLGLTEPMIASIFAKAA